MAFSTERIAYKQTGAFSALVNDYLLGRPELDAFLSFKPDDEGLKAAISERSRFPVDRPLLVEMLRQQYRSLPASAAVNANIEALKDETTFTVCTAHQPNTFTGHLYFIYKILHAIRLAEYLNSKHPSQRFVPVFYMGTEDADLDELGEVSIHGTSYHWKTDQQGAVGRMKIDRNLIDIADAICGTLSVEPFGKEIVAQIKACFVAGRAIQDATFQFVHEMFADYGLVILLPDQRDLKRAFLPIVKKEIQDKFSRAALDETLALFPQAYHAQTAGRELNLFYLTDSRRERIDLREKDFILSETGRVFSAAELLAEAEAFPERFSPNVILRPVYQEMILPNIAFIGGGGELAYWLELKKVFEAVDVFFPALILRNSFLLLPKKCSALLAKLGLHTADLFNSADDLIKQLVKRESDVPLSLSDESDALRAVYGKVRDRASVVDSGLSRHVAALQQQALGKVAGLEKKMLRAEKKKFEAQIRQIIKLKSRLFPNGGLQERRDNILEYLAAYGPALLSELYQASEAISKNFTVLSEN